MLIKYAIMLLIVLTFVITATFILKFIFDKNN
jgi:hypothetical protein